MSNPLSDFNRQAREALPIELERKLLPEPKWAVMEDFEGALFRSDEDEFEAGEKPKYPVDRYEKGTKLLMDGFNEILEAARDPRYKVQSATASLRALLDDLSNQGFGEIWDTMSRDIIHETFEKALYLERDKEPGYVFEWSEDIWNKRLRKK